MKGAGFPGAKEDIYTSGKGKEKRYIFNNTRLYTFLTSPKLYSNGKLDVLDALTSIFYLQFW